MAANYKVNIELDTKKLDAQLKRLKKQVGEVGKVKRVGGSRGGSGGSAQNNIFDLPDRIQVRNFAKSINPLLKKAEKVTKSVSQLALPSSEMIQQRKLADVVAKQTERKANAEKRSAEFAKEAMKANQASAKAGIAHAKKLERMRRDTGFTAAQYGPQFDSMSLPTESALNFDRRTGKLLRGPAGSSRNTLRNLGRRFDTQSALISGAFPLLFGQGPIGALAGGLGGGIGGMFGQMGGFAGDIAATAVVQTLSNVVDGVRKLGESLTTLDGQFKLLTEKSLFSTKEAENRAKVLQALGEREKLAKLVSQELANVLGQDGADKLRRAGEASKELNKTMAELTINLQLALAGPIAEFLKLVNKVLDQGTSISLGEGKGSVNLGPGEEKFLKDFNAVLVQMSQSQIDRIIRAQIGTNVEGINVTNTAKQAIRKFDLAKQTNPEGLDAFMGGKSSFAGGNTPLEVDAKRVASANRRIKSIQKELEFAKLVTEEGLKEANIQREIQEITENLNAEELKLLNTQGLTIRALLDKRDAAKEIIEEAQRVNTLFSNIKQTIETGLVNAIESAIDGTKTLGEVASSVFAAIQRELLGFGVRSLLKAFIPGFADGGRPPVGRPSIVGERGPELFVPDRSGTIIPNHKLGGSSTNIVVNVDASGSSIQGDDQQGKELGRLISVAVQSEIVQQRRPGGLLA